MDVGYEYLRGRHAERVASSLAAYATLRARARGACPLERLVRWIASRRQASLDPALLGR